ncbi:uncharacterized protein LOC143184729 [Calliopsis andreniformis]|uniref:uncharacterized protein LOC143184729 n=1 Tax=Calliopsis andreniformis TaxID=337506 RepID=UPI003FCED531
MAFDTERFILEVECRRAIWDVSHNDYSNRDIKRKQWEEIVNLFAVEGLSKEESKDLGLNLQKRWKNLRSCFTRELRRLKSAKSDSAASRKRPYIFYNQLSFLKNVTIDTNTESSMSEEDESTEQLKWKPYLRDGIPVRKKFKKIEENVNEEPINLLQRFVNAQMRRETVLEEDEDRMFLMSLLSSFRRIPENKKATTKIQIIKLIETAHFSDNISDLRSQLDIP